METCKEFITNLVITLPLLPPLLLLLFISSLTIAITFFLAQVYKTQKYLKDILRNKATLPKRIRKIAFELGIEDRLVATKRRNFTCFCFGLFSPKICLNLKFASSLTKEELTAVLLHEIHHLKSKDPLKILISQTLQSLLFFLPISRDLQNHYLLSQELAADQTVVKNIGIYALRRALIKSISLPERNFALASFFVEQSLEERIKILTSKSAKINIRISTFRLLASIFAVLIYLLFINLPIYAKDYGDDHSYYFCTSSQRLFTPANYSPNN